MRSSALMTGTLLSRRDLLALGCAASALPCVLAAAPSSTQRVLDAPARDALDRYVAAYLANMNAPGLVLAAVSRDGRADLAAYGFADLASQSRIMPGHLFQIGSISKSFAALAVLQLQDEGKLDVHHPILSYLPWLPIEQTMGEISVHHLLTHSSGFADDMPIFALDGRRWRPGFPAGARFHYSNWGFAVIGHLIEAIDGQSYAAAIEKRILHPLGMKDSAASITAASRARMVASYVPRDDRPYPRGGALVPAGPLNVTEAAGCVAATSHDMALYMTALANGGVGRNGRLVSERGFEQFSTPHIPARLFGRTASYGYGIAVDTLDNDRILRHTGGMVSFMSAMHVNLDAGLGAFVSINAQQGYRPNRVAQYALQLMRARADRKPPRADEDPRIENPQDYTGTYLATDGRRLTVGADDNGLLLDAGQGNARLAPFAPDAFLSSAPQFDLYPLVFERAPRAATPGAAASAVIGIGYGRDWYARDGAVAADGAIAVSDSDGDLRTYEGVYYSEDPWVGAVRVVARRAVLWIDGLTPLKREATHSFRYAHESGSPETAQFSAITANRAQLVCIGGRYLRRVALDG